MRRLLLLVPIAACSSSPTTNHTTPPGDDVYVAIDAAPVAKAPPDATPPPPPPPCLSPDVSLAGLGNGGLVLCEEEYGDAPSCMWAGVGAELAPTTVPAGIYPVVLISCSSDGGCDKALVCSAKDTCETVEPTLAAGEEILAADVDPTGARMAIVIRGAKADALELWDFPGRKRIARAELSTKGGVTGGVVGWLGDAMVVERGTEDGPVTATLWKLSGKKLKAGSKLPGNLRAFASLGADRAAIALDDQIAIYDAKTAKPLGAAKWTGIMGGAPLDDVVLEIVGADDTVGVLAMAGEDVLPVALGLVTPLTGADAANVSFSLCPEEGEGEEEEDEDEEDDE